MGLKVPEARPSQPPLQAPLGPVLALGPDEFLQELDVTVDFQTLPDATNYATSKTLNVAAKQIVVKIVSSNYQKLAN